MNTLSKKWYTRSVIMVLITALILTGCSTKTVTPAASDEAAKATEAPAASTAAETVAPKSEASTEPVTIRITLGDGEITKEQIAAFNQDHPKIKLVRVDADFSKMQQMMAANSEVTPDIIRVSGAVDTPFWVTRGLALDLEPYFKTSSVFKPDDIMEINNVFRFDGQKQGQGDIYGFVKDWSPDFDLFVNKKLFEAAGLPIPSTTEPMTWQYIAEISKKLTKKEGDTYTQYALTDVFTNASTANNDLIQAQMTSMGQSLFSPDYGKVVMDTPDVKKVLQYWVDAAKNVMGPSPLHPEAMGGWDLMGTGKMAMMICGYWASAVYRSDAKFNTHLQDYLYVPAPIWEGGKRVEASRAGVGAVIYSKTKHPNEAWTVFEWFFGGAPADERAKTGWGLPALKSKMALLPQETEFDKQLYAVVMEDMNHISSLDFNPYLPLGGFPGAFDKYFTPVYFDKDTVDGAIQKIAEDVNLQIIDTKEIIGIK